MNAFYEHHKDNIRFDYRCFDRILLHAAIQPFQQENRVGLLDPEGNFFLNSLAELHVLLEHRVVVPDRLAPWPSQKFLLRSRGFQSRSRFRSRTNDISC